MEDYHIVDTVLGKGGFGIVKLVYRNDDPQKKYLAMKQIRDENDNRKSAEKEATSLKDFQHPCIVRYIHSFPSEGEFDKFYCIVMEYCEGGNLANFIQHRGHLLDLERALYWLAQLTSAVAAIHAKNIIHRDIKPENVMLTRNLRVKLADFGLVKILGPSASLSFAGTRPYMAPEVLGLDKNTKYNSVYSVDIWSLGCVLYEMIALKPAFPCTDMDLWKQLENIKKGSFPPLIITNSNLSEEVGRLVKRMINVNSSERPTASSLLEDSIIKDYVNQFYMELEEENGEDSHLPQSQSRTSDELAAVTPNVDSGDYDLFVFTQPDEMQSWSMMVDGDVRVKLHLPPLQLPSGVLRESLDCDNVTVKIWAQRTDLGDLVFYGKSHNHENVPLIVGFGSSTGASPAAAVDAAVRVKLRITLFLHLRHGEDILSKEVIGSFHTAGEYRHWLLAFHDFPWNSVSARDVPVCQLWISPCYNSLYRFHWDGVEPMEIQNGQSYFVDWNELNGFKNYKRLWKLMVMNRIKSPALESLDFTPLVFKDGEQKIVVQMWLLKEGDAILVRGFINFVQGPLPTLTGRSVDVAMTLIITLNNGDCMTLSRTAEFTVGAIQNNFAKATLPWHDVSRSVAPRVSFSVSSDLS